MRLKQLLGIILLASATAMAAATVSQLGGVLVKNQDSAAVITILASGTFTHTEYRPTDNLMLVDLAEVSIANSDVKVHQVSAPGVKSYRVAGYRGAGDTEVARLPTASFEQLVARNPLAMREIAKVLVRRLESAPAGYQQPRTLPKTFALLPQAEGVDAVGFGRQLLG